MEVAREPLSDDQKRKRKLAKELGFGYGKRAEARLDRLIEWAEGLPKTERGYLPRKLSNDLYMLKVAAREKKRYKTPVQSFIAKKEALVDDPNNKNHMSAKAFRDRYAEIVQSLQAEEMTEYKRRQLRKMLNDLNKKVLAGDDAPLPEHIAKRDKAAERAAILASQSRERARFQDQQRARTRKAEQAKNEARLKEIRSSRAKRKIRKPRPKRGKKRK